MARPLFSTWECRYRFQLGVFSPLQEIQKNTLFLYIRSFSYWSVPAKTFSHAFAVSKDNRFTCLFVLKEGMEGLHLDRVNSCGLETESRQHGSSLGIVMLFSSGRLRKGTASFQWIQYSWTPYWSMWEYCRRQLCLLRFSGTSFCFPGLSRVVAMLQIKSRCKRDRVSYGLGWS